MLSKTEEVTEELEKSGLKGMEELLSIGQKWKFVRIEPGPRLDN